MKKKGSISNKGYLPDSPDRFNDFNIIPSPHITMKGVPHPVIGIDNLGNQKLMFPGEDYLFPGSAVIEYPVLEKGGGLKKGFSRYTSKNIQSSINEIFRRNEELFGPKGKKYYKPTDTMNTRKKQKGGPNNLPPGFTQDAIDQIYLNSLQGGMNTAMVEAFEREYGTGYRPGFMSQPVPTMMMPAVGPAAFAPVGPALPGEEYNIHHIYGNDIVGYKPDGTPIYRQFEQAPVTPQALPSQEKKATKKGYSESTANIQKKLNAMGANLVVDGIWGPKTQAAYDKYMGAKKPSGTMYAGKHSDFTGSPMHAGKFKSGGTAPAFPQQPTAAEFYQRGYVPNSPVGFYMTGGSTNQIAFPQQPPANMFFSGYPFTPQYRSGGDLPCMECGGAHMDEGGSVFGYGSFPATEFGGGVTMEDAENEFLETYKEGGNWIGKANRRMTAKGTKGAFTKYCGGKVTDECIQRGLNSPDPTTRKRAAFAKAMRKIRKEDGGEAPQNVGQESYLDQNKNTFNRFLRNNMLNAVEEKVVQDVFGNPEPPSPMLYAQDGVEVPEYLTRSDAKTFLDEYFRNYMTQMPPQQGYYVGQRPSYPMGYGMFPYNPTGPYYKTKFKGWSNMPTTYSWQPGTGYTSSNPTAGMTPAQIQQYWADKGFKANVEQDIKSGFLHSIAPTKFAPRRVKTNVSLELMPGQTQATAPGTSPQTDFAGMASDPEGRDIMVNQTPFTFTFPSAPSSTTPQGSLTPDQMNDLLYGRQKGGSSEVGNSMGYSTDERRRFGVFANPSTAPWMVAGLDFGAKMFSADEEQAMLNRMRSRQGADANYYAQMMNKGNYTFDPYAGQSFRPDEMGAKVQPWAMNNVGAMNLGNPYQSKFGGETDYVYMDDDEIAEFMAKGGTIQYLD